MHKNISNEDYVVSQSTLEYRKEYYKRNKEKIIGRLRVKVRCDICNIEIDKGNLKTHYRSYKHQRNNAKNTVNTIDTIDTIDTASVNAMVDALIQKIENINNAITELNDTTPDLKKMMNTIKKLNTKHT